MPIDHQPSRSQTGIPPKYGEVAKLHEEIFRGIDKLDKALDTV